MNPGPPTPQAGILNQSSRSTPSIPANQDEAVARRLPQTPQLAKCEEQIQKTIERATTEGKKPNTIISFNHRLRQLDKIADLMNPTDVKTAIAYSKLKNSSKSSFVLAYEWFVKTNGLQWEKPKYKWELPTPIIPTKENVTKIISAATKRYATIFTILMETGADGEELHNTHRNQIDIQQGIISIKGVKGHASANYKLSPHTIEMLKEYLAKNPQDYPFPQSKAISEIWRDTRDKLADTLKQPELKQIPLKSLRNYSGAQFYYRTNDPIGVMRHLRHKRLETTMHYLRAIVLDGEEEYTCKTAKTLEEAAKLIELGFQYITEMDGIKLFKKRK